LLKFGTIILALLIGLRPRRKSFGQVAALTGAVFAALQLTSNFWLYFYVVWFLPFLLIALFAETALTRESMRPAPTAHESDAAAVASA
jgi:hypothetical protein